MLFIHNLDSKPREIAFSTGLGEGAATGRLLVNLLSDDHSRRKHGRHRLIVEGYGYRWYRVGGLDYLLRRSEVDNISSPPAGGPEASADADYPENRRARHSLFARG